VQGSIFSYVFSLAIPSYGGIGGALVVDQSDLTVSSVDGNRCLFVGCEALVGGSIAAVESSVVLQDVDFFQGGAFFQCGAVFMVGETLDTFGYFTGCMFVNTSAGELGGAVGVTGVASSSITNCDFINCHCSSEGGSLFGESSLLVVSHCHFLNNSVGGRGSIGDNSVFPELHLKHRVGRVERSRGGGGAIVFHVSSRTFERGVLFATDAMDALFATESCCFSGNRIEADDERNDVAGIGLDVLVDGTTYQSYDDRFLNLEGVSVSIRQGSFAVYNSLFYVDNTRFLSPGHFCANDELKRAYEMFVPVAPVTDEYVFSSLTETAGGEGISVFEVSVADGTPLQTRVPQATPLGRTVVTQTNNFTQIPISYVSPLSPPSPTANFTISSVFTDSFHFISSDVFIQSNILTASVLFDPSNVFVASATFTPVASPTRSPRPSPSQSRLPAAIPLSMSVSEVQTVVESISHSLEESASISVTFMEVDMTVESETVVESQYVMTEESEVEIIVYGSDSETFVTRSVLVVEVTTVSRSVAMVAVTTRTMISSVLISLTFVQVEMPVFVTVVSQIVMAIERPTSMAGVQVSNATLIGGVSGGAVLLLVLIGLAVWARNQGKNDHVEAVEDDFAFLAEDIVSRTVSGTVRKAAAAKTKATTVDPVESMPVVRSDEEKVGDYSESDGFDPETEISLYSIQNPEVSGWW
jgi:hypothetical protein